MFVNIIRCAERIWIYKTRTRTKKNFLTQKGEKRVSKYGVVKFIGGMLNNDLNSV